MKKLIVLACAVFMTSQVFAGPPKYNDSNASRSALGLAIGSDVQAYDADLADLADGSLTGSKVGDGVPAANIAAGSMDDDVIVSSAHPAAFFSRSDVRTNLGLSIGSDVQAYDADLADLADGSLTGSKVGDGVPAANIAAGSVDSDVIVSSAHPALFYSRNDVRTNLGLAIGTNVQAYDDDLADLADGELTGSKIGSGVPAANIASGSLGASVMASSVAVGSCELAANIAAANITAGTLDTDVQVSSFGVAAFTDAVNNALKREGLGVKIGTDVQGYDDDLADLADGSLTGSKVGDGVAAANIAAGAIPSDVSVSSLTVEAFTDAVNNAAKLSALGGQATDSDLDDLADGSLTGSKVGDGVAAANIAAGSLDTDVIVSSVAVGAVYALALGDDAVEAAKLDDDGVFVVGQIKATPPSPQTIGAGETIAADACGGLKQITAAGPVTTATDHTFTAPAAGNAGCCMNVCNVGVNAITLDNNGEFKSAGAANVEVGADDCLSVCSTGAGGVWYQISALLAN